MKLHEIVEHKLEIYHSTNSRFDKFKSRPTWFSVNKRDALGWHKGHPNSITYACTFTGNIATEKESQVIAQGIWPTEDFIYSMFDEAVGEFPAVEVKKFITELQEAGYSASYLADYDPEDFNSGSTRSLCVFDPADSVQMNGVLKDDESNSEFKVDDKVRINVGDMTTNGIITAVKGQKLTVSYRGWNDEIEDYEQMTAQLSSSDVKLIKK